MKIYNTLSRTVEELKPIKDGEIRLYTCGPTVYHYYHIGNLRNAIFNDVLRRSLTNLGFEVKHVMNITDVGHLVSDSDEGEDKLEKGAAREGKTVWEIAKHYTDAFKQDMSALNVLPPNIEPNREKNRAESDNYARATDFIPEQIEMVSALLEKGFAYQTKQAIYFDVTKLPSYGEITGQKLSEKEISSREDVVSDPDKHSPYDFAVWFFTVGRYADHTMHWASPWGDGFPGWHLECSAIIHTILGDPIDIHTGGVDHIGTHHPNEIAQTEAAFNHKLANYWLHNEFLLVDGEKMSKSKGNSYILKDISDKGFRPIDYRYFCLQAHYRTQLNFTWESLKAASTALDRLYSQVSNLKILAEQDNQEEGLNSKDYTSAFTNTLADDLNTPKALSVVWELIGDREISNKNKYAALLSFDSVLGLGLDNPPQEFLEIPTEIKNLADQREEARQRKDFTSADQLRDQINQAGFSIDDTPYGPLIKRTK